MGPQIKFLSGRQDVSTPNPPNLLPSGNSSAVEILALFSRQGFNSKETVALTGAHTAAKIQGSGLALDSTVSDWDNRFYSESADGTAPFTMPSDRSLSSDVATSGDWKQFASDTGVWIAAFVPA
jgi:manganese peroxidase